MLRHPFFSAGFRPFFLGAAVLAATSIPAWAMTYAALIDPGLGIRPAWHAHEMVFGYMLAVLAGFLTIRLSGWPVLILVCIWAAGRAAMVGEAAFPFAAAVIDLSFVPVLIAFRRPALWMVWKWPNGLFLPLLLSFWAVNLGYHLGAAIPWTPDFHAAPVDLATLLLVVIAGRLVPGYTGAALTHIRPPREGPIEAVSVALLIGATVLHVSQLPISRGRMSHGRRPAAGPAHDRLAPVGNARPSAAVDPASWVRMAGARTGAPRPRGPRARCAPRLGRASRHYGGRDRLDHPGHDDAHHTRSYAERRWSDPWTTSAFALVQIAAALRVFGPIAAGDAVNWIGTRRDLLDFRFSAVARPQRPKTFHLIDGRSTGQAVDAGPGEDRPIDDREDRVAERPQSARDDDDFRPGKENPQGGAREDKAVGEDGPTRDASGSPAWPSAAREATARIITPMAPAVSAWRAAAAVEPIAEIGGRLQKEADRNHRHSRRGGSRRSAWRGS